VPILGRLRSQALFHLPFASIEETLYRTVGDYLIKQFFIMRDGGQPDFALVGLEALYSELAILNISFFSRIQAASAKDANLNAVVMMSSMSEIVSISLDRRLEPPACGDAGDGRAGSSRFGRDPSFSSPAIAILIQVKLVDDAVEYRRKDDTHRRQENNPAEQGISRRENLGRRALHRVDRTHARQDHRRIEFSIDPGQSRQLMITQRADHEGNTRDRECQQERHRDALEEARK